MASQDIFARLKANQAQADEQKAQQARATAAGSNSPASSSKASASNPKPSASTAPQSRPPTFHTVVESSTSSSSSSSAYRARVLLPIDSLKALKIQTGDAVLLYPGSPLESAIPPPIAVATVWPSFALDNATVQLPPLLSTSQSFLPGEHVGILPIQGNAAEKNSGPSRLPIASAIRLHILSRERVDEDSVLPSSRIVHAGSSVQLGADVKLPRMDRNLLSVFVKEALIELECVHVCQALTIPFQGSLYEIQVHSVKDLNQSEGLKVRVPLGSTSKARHSTAEIFAVSRFTEVTVCTPPKGGAASTLGRDETAVVTKDSKLPLPSQSKARAHQVEQRAKEAYADIGGLDKQIEEIRALVEMPLTRPEIFVEYGLKPPKGVLLFGPPGTGKTSLAKAVAASTGSSFLTINGPELSSAFHGETESKLRAAFREARRKSPCVIIIDEIDALAPRREGGSGDGGGGDGAGEVERRVVAQLLTLLDGMEDGSGEDLDSGDEDDDQDDQDGSPGRGDKVASPPRIVVLAATNRPNAIDPALRRPGRLDREIEIGIPSASSRLSILNTLLRKVPHSLNEEQISDLAARTHGFVGADLSALVREAGMKAVRRAFDRQAKGIDDELSKAMGSIRIHDPPAEEGLCNDDFTSALPLVRPSAMREIFLEPPKVYWSDIAGSDSSEGHQATKSVHSQVRELVEWPLKHADVFRRLGVQPPRGVLLYGPPGCSKTLIARALATESGLNFIAVKGPELYSKYVGESERAVREIFKKARAASPSIIFFDEIDALTTTRSTGSEAQDGPSDRVIASLLNEMDGIETLSNVIIVAATNRPEIIDPALLRPGRLDRLLYVGPPDQKSRRQILEKRTSKMSVQPDLDLESLASLTQGCSGAEVVSICQEAGILAMNEDIDCRF
ncbi:AAA-domain-containing protein, partial [Violaceomyces palustris]